ncbi:KptA family-domain-containing protein [Mycena alexandri]|uniref:2'-phosphotransferase n=1 Tax=Mycena alexandri TaxID=1745969 RepID=A0AAD6X413_9AGAR|nr:KptA family-domain-containing protein [Mycena alexandri]
MFPAAPFHGRCRKSFSIIFRAYSDFGDRPPPAQWHRPRKKGPDRQQLRVSRHLARLLRPRGDFPTRSNGYVSVEALLKHAAFRGVDFAMLEKVVRDDQKARYHLVYEPWEGLGSSWWIRSSEAWAREVPRQAPADTSLDLRRLTSALQIPTVLHGTTLKAWEAISQQPGLHRMSQSYIHLATEIVGDTIKGMDNPSEVLISIDVARALKADVKFYVARDGVVLTPGNTDGYLERRFFQRVEQVKVSATPVRGWDREELYALRRVVSAEEVSEVVHGTSVRAWDAISTQPGIHRMSRNYIHLGQGVKGNVVNGMQRPSEILINIDIANALAAEIEFYVSRSGAVLTPGNADGFLERRFFSGVESTVPRRPSRAQTLLRRWARMREELHAFPRRFPIPLIGPPVKGLKRPRAAFFQHLHKRESYNGLGRWN